jgi:hypothetical protein
MQCRQHHDEPARTFEATGWIAFAMIIKNPAGMATNTKGTMVMFAIGATSGQRKK